MCELYDYLRFYHISEVLKGPEVGGGHLQRKKTNYCSSSLSLIKRKHEVE